MASLKICLVALVAVICAIETCYASQAYQQTALNLHNQYRAQHGAPPLQLDENLNAAALKCANYYANQGRNDHTCPYKGDAGENIVGGPGSFSPDQLATMGTNMWYKEGDVYDYNYPGFTMQTGHFTQLVWKSSQTFGFAVVTLDNGNGPFTSGVGLYNPSGNYEGEFPDNVLPLQ